MSQVTVTFIHADGKEQAVTTEAGATVLQLAHEIGLEMEGACEGNMACSTCHVIVDDADFDKLPEASEEEEEMLDLALGLTATSRLGCQVVLTPELDGLRLHIPQATRNMMGF
ncbi:ferredoxin family 2Fe-2S iron-sulfur cluster binding protein [Kordiimonas gwangyangensis]|uniref:ferredoxin family 2Fe-2S iron-sulfur cluster binding protein n=1 Tax=Kordiimonas gwangyangensis TaxID=288022 RepID=UPI000380368B|nr:ferredoxin family 2Fe-2S iron-sulfur cluster binding protein [Kordiimonas gwangyangensis]